MSTQLALVGKTSTLIPHQEQIASPVSFGNRDLLSPTLTWQLLLLKINSKQKTDKMWQK